MTANKGFSFVLKRKAWSDTIDFYTGGRHKFFVSLTQHMFDPKTDLSFDDGAVVASANIVELFLAHDPAYFSNELSLTDSPDATETEGDGASLSSPAAKPFVLLTFLLLFSS